MYKVLKGIAAVSTRPDPIRTIRSGLLELLESKIKFAVGIRKGRAQDRIQ